MQNKPPTPPMEEIEKEKPTPTIHTRLVRKDGHIRHAPTNRDQFQTHPKDSISDSSKDSSKDSFKDPSSQRPPSITSPAERPFNTDTDTTAFSPSPRSKDSHNKPKTLQYRPQLSSDDYPSARSILGVADLTKLDGDGDGGTHSIGVGDIAAVDVVRKSSLEIMQFGAHSVDHHRHPHSHQAVRDYLPKGQAMLFNPRSDSETSSSSASSYVDRDSMDYLNNPPAVQNQGVDPARLASGDNLATNNEQQTLFPQGPGAGFYQQRQQQQQSARQQLLNVQQPYAMAGAGAPADRFQSQDRVHTLYGSITNNAFARPTRTASIRPSKKKTNRKLLSMFIQAEEFDLPSNRRYMVPRYDTSNSSSEATSPNYLEQRTMDRKKSPSGDLLQPKAIRAYVVLFTPRGSEEYETSDLNMFLNAMQKNSAYKNAIKWIYIEGETVDDAVDLLQPRYKIHPLVAEDIVNTPQRAKLDQYDESIFMVTHSPELFEGNYGLEFVSNQVSIILLCQQQTVLSFQEHENIAAGNWAARVRERIRNNVDDIRSRHVSYLLYAVVDSILDRYFPLLEFYGDRMEELESAVIDDPQPALIKGITRLKRDMLMLRRNIWPMRDSMSRLTLLPDDVIHKVTKTYLRDTHDHMIQIVDILETYRDVSMGLLDLYLGATDNKMQEIMKTLTVISTTFIPLTFLTGVYGMNFEHMPELQWPFSYAAFWILTAIIIFSQFYIFHQRGWV